MCLYVFFVISLPGFYSQERDKLTGRRPLCEWHGSV